MGLSSMIGAGAFVSLGGAYAAAGPLLLVSVLLALAVAWANATSTAQLSAQYPSSGGTYVFGRKQLGPWWGFIAGWGFVVGKTASCAAMALVVANYVMALITSPPLHGDRAVAFGQAEGNGTSFGVTILAVLIVMAVTGVNLVGITRTTQAATVLLSISVPALLLVAGRLAWAQLSGEAIGGVAPGAAGPVPEPFGAGTDGVLARAISPSFVGVLQGAAVMFFAFAGYARVATLGEEVKEPRRTIPRAIMIALWCVAALYLLLGAVITWVLGGAAGNLIDIHMLASAPLASMLRAVGAGTFWIALVALGAAAAGTGALLALVAGVSRTMLAMARERDLPEPLADVDPKHSVPQRAQIAVGLGIGLLALSGELLHAIEFSALGVLTYYFVANVAAATQEGEWRIAPRLVNIVGAVGCVALVASLPWQVIVVGLAVFAIGIAYRALRVSSRKRA